MRTRKSALLVVFFLLYGLLPAAGSMSGIQFVEMCSKASPAEIQAAIEAGADVNAGNEHGHTPLMEAASFNTPQTVALLLKAGADLAGTDRFGRNALMRAARYTRYPENIAILLDAGADVRARSRSGESAVDSAQFNEELKKSEEYLRLLLAATMHGEHLEELVQVGSPSDIRAAINAGCNVNGRNREGLTSLMLTVKYNPDPQIIRILLEAGAEVDAKDKGAWSARMYAVSHDTPDSEVIKTLVEGGANVNSMDFYQDTVLMIALKHEVPEEIEVLLRSLGAQVR